jgi:hypothetical protein
MPALDVETRFKQTGRNDDCPCGSGKKYKKCHLREDEEAVSKALAERNAEAAKAAQVEEPGHEGHGHAPGMHGVEEGGKPKFEAPKSVIAGPKQAKVAKAVNTPRKAV